MKLTYKTSIFILLTCSLILSVNRAEARSNPYEFGVYIYKRTLTKFKGREKELTNICSDLKFTEVYLSFSNRNFERIKDDYIESLSKLIALFHQNGIKVYALAFDDPTMIFKAQKVDRTIKNINSFNKLVKENSKFDGACADLEPHMIKKGRKWSIGAPYLWSKNGYTAGNKKLLELTLNTLKTISLNLNNSHLSEAVPWFYFKNFDFHGYKLGNKFASSGCNYLIAMAYSDKPEKIVKFSKYALEGIDKDKSVMIGVKTSLNTEGGGGSNTSLNSLGRSDLIKAVNQLIESNRQYKSLRGIAFFEFDGFMEIWNRKSGVVEK